MLWNGGVKVQASPYCIIGHHMMKPLTGKETDLLLHESSTIDRFTDLKADLFP
jgi:hypothetical protein